jgi:hypothetical protein
VHHGGAQFVIKPTRAQQAGLLILLAVLAALAVYRAL